MIQQLVRELDREGSFFRLEDTGKDIEIILTVEGRSGIKEFDKGEGIGFLDEQIDLGLSGGITLVCGDTASDIPMVTEAGKRSANVWAIFVTREEILEKAVLRACPQSHIVGEPDILVCLLNQLAGNSRLRQRR